MTIYDFYFLFFTYTLSLVFLSLKLYLYRLFYPNFIIYIRGLLEYVANARGSWF